MRKTKNIDMLLEYLENGSNDDPDAEWKAAIALGDIQLPEEKQRAVPALLKSLTSRSAHALTRAHTAEALGKLEDPSAVPPLIGALKDDYQLVRSYAARALGKLGDPKAIGPLMHSLGHDQFFGTRAEAAEALHNLCPDDRTPLCKKVRRALHIYREKEIKHLEHKKEEGRSRRVLAEIDRALFLNEEDKK